MICILLVVITLYRCINLNNTSTFLCVWTADGHSIYIKGLPVNATPALLENEFKKFGPIKSGGIQVRSQKVRHMST